MRSEDGRIIGRTGCLLYMGFIAYIALSNEWFDGAVTKETLMHAVPPVKSIGSVFFISLGSYHRSTMRPGIAKGERPI